MRGIVTGCGALAIVFTLACAGMGPTGPAGSGTAPLYGTADLAGGFVEHAVDLRAGGSTSAQDAGFPDHCMGYLAPDQPDYRVVLSSPGPQIRFAACSDADTALVIREPRGSVLCNDDGEGSNPVVEIKAAGAGTYDIWVATYSEGNSAQATLHAIEADGGICARVNVGAPPSQGTLALAPGFGVTSQAVTAGGSTPAGMPSGMSGCSGHIDGNAPTVRIDLAANAPLNVGSCAPTDTTLAIRNPQGTWHCDDDSEGSDPVVRFARAGAGSYDVYVGTYGSSSGDTTATLTIKEQPGPLCSTPSPFK